MVGLRRGLDIGDDACVVGGALGVDGTLGVDFFLLFFADSVEMLEAGEILCGIPWGVFQSLTTVYAAEVCPVNLRACLTTYVNLCRVLGTILGQGVLRGFLNDADTTGQWAYPSMVVAYPHRYRGAASTRIALVAYLCGLTFMNHSTYFFQQAALDEKGSFDVALEQYALGALRTMLVVPDSASGLTNNPPIWYNCYRFLAIHHRSLKLRPTRQSPG